jgi:hypothetical protein
LVTGICAGSEIIGEIDDAIDRDVAGGNDGRNSETFWGAYGL